MEGFLAMEVWWGNTRPDGFRSGMFIADLSSNRAGYAAGASWIFQLKSAGTFFDLSSEQISDLKDLVPQVVSGWISTPGWPFGAPETIPGPDWMPTDGCRWNLTICDAYRDLYRFHSINIVPPRFFDLTQLLRQCMGWEAKQGMSQ